MSPRFCRGPGSIQLPDLRGLWIGAPAGEAAGVIGLEVDECSGGRRGQRYCGHGWAPLQAGAMSGRTPGGMTGSGDLTVRLVRGGGGDEEPADGGRIAVGVAGRGRRERGSGSLAPESEEQGGRATLIVRPQTRWELPGPRIRLDPSLIAAGLPPAREEVWAASAGKILSIDQICDPAKGAAVCLTAGTKEAERRGKRRKWRRARLGLTPSGGFGPACGEATRSPAAFAGCLRTE
jgi:hypothetical protein